MSALIMGLALLALSLLVAPLARAQMRREAYRPKWLLVIPASATRPFRAQARALARRRGYGIVESHAAPPDTCYVMPAEIKLNFIQPETPWVVRHRDFDREVGRIMFDERIALTVQRPRTTLITSVT